MCIPLLMLAVTYQYGLSTPLHGARHTTGSYCSNGVSVFSFKGVYRAPMGTTRREASCSSGQRLVIRTLLAGRTMRELGNVFQLRRIPSRSSTSLHWSFNASKSAILCR
jgi:hypothetical protein